MKFKKISAIIIGVTSFFCNTSEGQINPLLYGFDALPQSQYFNPSQNINARFHIGIPALSGINLNYENSAFSPLDLFEKGTDINRNLDKVIGELKPEDYLNLKIKLDLLDIGFNTKVGYFTLGSYSETNLYMDYPIELLKLIRFDGSNYLGEDLSFDKLNFESSSFVATYLGYRTNLLDDKLSIGVRYKYLTGLAHGYTEKMDVGIRRIDDFTLNLRSNTLAKVSGIIDLEDGSVGENTGHAMDLGLTYHLTDKISFGASIIDLGSITWKGEQIHYSTSGEYNYTGIDIDLNADDPFDDGSQRILDELEEELQFKEDTVSGSYNRSLQTQYIISGSYRIGKSHTFTGIYSMKKAYENNLHNFSANYYFNATRAIQLMSSISLNESQTKIGAGLALRLGYFQMYMMTDNIIKTFDYGRLRNVNLTFGLNIYVPEKQEFDDENYLERKKRKLLEKKTKKEAKKQKDLDKKEEKNKPKETPETKAKPEIKEKKKELPSDIKKEKEDSKKRKR